MKPLAPSALETMKSKRAEPRVPFGAILELGILRAGSPLFDERRSIRAEIKADGSLAVPGSQGSIHRLGAIVQGKTACNGWTFWHFESNGRLKPIDALREEAKRKLGLSGDADRRSRASERPNKSAASVAEQPIAPAQQSLC